MPTPVAFAYYSIIVLSGSHNNLVFRVAVAEHVAFCVRLFILYALYGRSCRANGDFLSVKNPCRNGILLHLSQRVLDSVQDVGFFETVCGCIFHIVQAYLTFRRIVEIDWATKEDFEWF